jgi:hypothetical protein
MRAHRLVVDARYGHVSYALRWSKRGKGNVFALVVDARDGHESSALRVHYGRNALSERSESNG